MTMQRRLVLGLSFAVAALALTTGCATLPAPDVMKAETAGFQLPKLPADGQAMVYVVRPSGLGGLIRFNVFVDDKEPASEMGYTRSSQYIYFTLPPGKHVIYSKAENWAEIPVEASAGDVIFIQQDPTMGVIMARNSLAKVDDLQGKYHVKKLTVGTILKTEK
jgi:hypothetical protein